MGKETVFYITAAVLFGCGLWGVLAAGRELQAPFHLAGVWHPVDDQAATRQIVLAQSGQFLTLRLDKQNPIALRWSRESPHEAGGFRIEWHGEGQTLDVYRPADCPSTDALECRFVLDGAIQADWVLRRSPRGSGA